MLHAQASERELIDQFLAALRSLPEVQAELERVGSPELDVQLAIDEASVGELLGIHHRRIHIGEDLELVRDPGVVTVRRHAVGDRAFAVLTIGKRRYHTVLHRHLSDPGVRQYGHGKVLNVQTVCHLTCACSAVERPPSS